MTAYIDDLKGVRHHGYEHIEQDDNRGHVIHDEHAAADPLRKVMRL